MHVAALADYGGPYAGSFVPVLAAVGREARSRGHTFEVVFTPVARDRPWLPELEGIPVSFSSGRSLRELASAVPRADVLHTHFTSFDVPALLAARGRARVIWHVHTRMDPRLRVRAANAVKYGVLGRRVGRIVCVAPHIEAMVRRRLAPPARTMTILNAIDAGRFPLRTTERVAAAREALGIAPAERVLLHFGRLWHLKGGDVLLEAVRRLDEEVLVLTVAGEDARRNARELGLDGAVRTLEPVTDVAALYTAADLFVSCSREEGMPYSLLEAAASGTGVVASDIPGQGQIAARLPGARVAALEPAALAAAIDALLGRTAVEARADGEAARAWVRSHADLAIGARRLVDVYEQV